MTFVNTLPYKSNPIDEFHDFKLVSWEKDIYPKFKGNTQDNEIKFFKQLLKKHKLRKILDFGGGTREYTKKAQQSIVTKFSQLIKKDGYLFIDSRNYDYIKSLMHLPTADVFRNFTFDYSIYYHGFQTKILVFPAYISETVVVLHYYDKENKTWSKLDLYPIYQEDMIEILSKDFVIEKIYHDFKEGKKNKSLFVQYLARRK